MCSAVDVCRSPEYILGPMLTVIFAIMIQNKNVLLLAFAAPGGTKAFGCYILKIINYYAYEHGADFELVPDVKH